MKLSPFLFENVIHSKANPSKKIRNRNLLKEVKNKMKDILTTD